MISDAHTSERREFDIWNIKDVEITMDGMVSYHYYHGYLLVMVVVGFRIIYVHIEYQFISLAHVCCSAV